MTNGQVLVADNRESFLLYWGKMDDQSPGQNSYHLLPYHCLDVAAVGQVLLRHQPSWVKDVADFLSWDEDILVRWLTFLFSLHDIGKFADGFQNLNPELATRLQGRRLTANYSERHDTLGFRFCDREEFAKLLFRDGPNLTDLRDLLRPWLSAVTGHHGKPPIVQGFPQPLSRQFPGPADESARYYIRAIKALFLREDEPAIDMNNYSLLETAFRRISWLTAGLMVAADWIGSNQSWFPFMEMPMPLEEYWRTKALPQAEIAVRESGLLCLPPAQPAGIRHLYPGIEIPTPLQEFAERIELDEYPQLFIVEEVTGGGKTEAAVTLAQRIMAKGAADGIYLALPTMATANAMHRRVRDVYKKLYAENTNPSFILAHSASRMYLDLEERNRPDKNYAPGDPTASGECSAWLADSRKKALLAHVGIGTIDQALLAILPARHQSMRLFGLSRKVLIVDEVHACDAYVHRLLCTLLEFHAALGGCAILLSATLPQRMRAELIQAFARGLDPTASATPAATAGPYPLLTHITTGGMTEIAFAARASASRRVEVSQFVDERAIEAALRATVVSGGCACWVRNTVDDALEAWQRLSAEFGADRVLLYHARFALGDRLDREGEVLRLFGVNSAARERSGRLLIATQVVEQSLDLDFDFMVSDLAPIDLLIQRAGRLRRHCRDEHGNRIEGPDRRGTPVSGIFMPAADQNAKKEWFSGAFPRGRFVYPHHGQLWLTARWLQEHRSFTIPEDARDMIESVYAEMVQNAIPEGLVRAANETDGQIRAMAAQGNLISLDLAQGYRATAAHWHDDIPAPTRLGDPTTIVRLGRWEEDRLLPWAGGDACHAWDLSQVSVRKYRISRESPEHAMALAEARKSMRDGGKWCVIVPLAGDGLDWFGQAVDDRGNEIRIMYNHQTGLQFLPEEKP